MSRCIYTTCSLRSHGYSSSVQIIRGTSISILDSRPQSPISKIPRWRASPLEIGEGKKKKWDSRTHVVGHVGECGFLFDQPMTGAPHTAKISIAHLLASTPRTVLVKNMQGALGERETACAIRLYSSALLFPNSHSCRRSPTRLTLSQVLRLGRVAVRVRGLPSRSPGARVESQTKKRSVATA